jgi:hypothetical protein
MQGMLDSAKALAMTAADLMTNPELLSLAKTEFFRHKRKSGLNI